jgi:hypothetical protein
VHEGRSTEREYAGSASGAMEEFAAFHGAPCGSVSRGSLPPNGRAKRTLVYEGER